MNITTIGVYGFEQALHGMRNPKNSWDKHDTRQTDGLIIIGNNDMKLAKTLVKAGAEHRKFLRQIQVWADVTMPRYWWVEADTYHFGTTNSTSTMHKLFSKDYIIERNMFHYRLVDIEIIDAIIHKLNTLRLQYLRPVEEGELSRKNEILARAKQILPEGFLQMRTWNTNYEELANMYHQRKDHRLREEWNNTFCKWVEELPYFKEMILDVLEVASE